MLVRGVEGVENSSGIGGGRKGMVGEGKEGRRWNKIDGRCL